MALAPGTRIGAYEIVSAIGAGGMGEIYRARDVRLQRDVAIKVLPGDTASDAGAILRFQREARAASALNHPHILTIYDIGRMDSEPHRDFIAM
ncbi:MAG TPA: protein kinase, partial [Thermoanaerobaculia bacterium]